MNNLVITGADKLPAPLIDINNRKLTISDSSGAATHFDIYVDNQLKTTIEPQGYVVRFNINYVSTETDGAYILIYDGKGITAPLVYNSENVDSAPPSFWNNISVRIFSGDFYMQISGTKIQLKDFSATNTENFYYDTTIENTAIVSGHAIGNVIISGNIILDA